MTRIVICRHGNTFDKGDVVTRVGARTDLPLSSSGRAQAEILAAELSEYNFTHAYCSPLMRTQQTAMAIICLLYTSPSPRDDTLSRMPSSA